MSQVKKVAVMLIVAVTSGATLHGQEKPASGQAPAGAELVSLTVDVVLSRHQGEKLISSLPYSLAVTANDPRNNTLRMGADVPILAMAMPTTPEGQPVTGAVQAGPINYRPIGTSIDCSATTVDDGRYRLSVTIEDASVYADDQAPPDVTRARGAPVFRSFRSSNTVVLRDGQSVQYTAATDKITGEVVRVDVTLNVLK